MLIKSLAFIVLLSFLSDSLAQVTEIRTYDIVGLGIGSGGAAASSRFVEAGFKTVVLELGFHIEQTYNPDLVRNLDDHKWVKFNPQLETYYFGEPNQVSLSNGTTVTISQQSNRANMVRGCGGHNGGLARWGVDAIYDTWPRGWRSNNLDDYLEEAYERMNTQVPRKHRALQSKVMNQWQRSTGYPIVPDSDLDGELRNGIQRTKFTYKSYDNDNFFDRVSSYDAFVLKCKRSSNPSQPSRDCTTRRNLDIHTRMRVDRLLLDYTRVPKPHVQGVLATNLTDGKQYVYYATKGVNSYLGTYENVALFGRSAMGNCAQLNESLVPIVNMDKCIDMPEIGKFFTHHVLAALTAINETDVINAPNTQFTTQVGVGFSTEGKNYPDAFIDFHMQTAPAYLGPNPLAFAILYSLKDWPGTIRLDPTDPYKLKIDFELFQHPWQMPHLIKVVREYQKLIQATSVYTFELPAPFSPGYQWAQTDDQIRDLIPFGIANGEHPVSSLAIGKIVDERLRVTKVTGLRVMDASVLPSGNHANVNMITVAAALKGADMMIDDLK